MDAKQRFSFTKRGIEALSPPVGQREYHYDEKTEGLCLCVTPNGAKTFYLYKWLDGQPVRIPLGKFPILSVENARDACRKLLGLHAQGVDIRAARQAARHEHNLNGLWEHWLEYAKAHKKTWAEDQRKYNAFLKPWAARRLSGIKKSDVQALHTRVGKENGQYLANRLLDLLGAMYNKARDIGYTGENPTAGIKKFREVKRDRFLTGDELPAFFKALAAEKNDLLRDFFLIALLVGARRSNVQAMAWADIDLDNAYWRIPETKSGVPVVVPLVLPALAILQTRRKARKDSPYVFPSFGKSGHLVEPKSAWKRICTTAGLSGVRIHDLRRSLGSWQAMGGASLPIIGKSLGHTQVKTTAIYARLQMDPVRTSVESATTAIMQAGKVTMEDGNLVIDVTNEKITEQEKGN
jgi:integrase